MGHSFTAKCKKCNAKFTVSEGGGFMFHELRCDKCGHAKGIGFDEIGDPHLRWRKGLPGPWTVGSQEFDDDIKNNYPGEPLSDEEYHKIIEEMVGKCKKCQEGQYRFDAPARCPECKSTEFEDTGEDWVCYD